MRIPSIKILVVCVCLCMHYEVGSSGSGRLVMCDLCTYYNLYCMCVITSEHNWEAADKADKFRAGSSSWSGCNWGAAGAMGASYILYYGIWSSGFVESHSSTLLSKRKQLQTWATFRKAKTLTQHLECHTHPHTGHSVIDSFLSTKTVSLLTAWTEF